MGNANALKVNTLTPSIAFRFVLLIFYKIYLIIKSAVYKIKDIVQKSYYVSSASKRANHEKLTSFSAPG